MNEGNIKRDSIVDMINNILLTIILLLWIDFNVIDTKKNWINEYEE